MRRIFNKNKEAHERSIDSHSHGGEEAPSERQDDFAEKRARLLTPRKGSSRPSTSDSSVSKQHTSSSGPESSSSFGCEQTYAETVVSSNWSQSVAGTNRTDDGTSYSSMPWPVECSQSSNPLSYFQNCLVCFWPTFYGADENKSRVNCFVEIADSSGGLKESDRWNGQLTPMFGTRNTYSTTTPKNSTNFREQQTKLKVITEFPDKSKHVGHHSTPKDASSSKSNNGSILFTPKIVLSSKVPFFHFNSDGKDSRSSMGENKALRNSISLPGLTPVSFDSKVSFADSTPRNSNEGTRSSTNTLHRRTDASVGFFTASMDQILATSSPEKIERKSLITPRNQEHSSGAFKFDEPSPSLSAFKTPKESLRDSSTSFRKTIKLVTCEKKVNADGDDVSPMGSDDGFSAAYVNNNGLRRSTTSTQSAPSSGKSAYKKLRFEVDESAKKNKSGDYYLNGDKEGGNFSGIKLFGDFGAERGSINQQGGISPKFGLNVMKSVQSFFSLTSNNSNLLQMQVDDSSEAKENAPNKTIAPALSKAKSKPLDISKEDQVRLDMFLQKSGSFIKILRKTGRKGKPLIQGWVAFRQSSVTWSEVIRDPKRCDFRYIVILDDMPLLHIFNARTKQKKGKKRGQDNNNAPIEGCVSLELTDDIIVETKLVSKGLGNEIRILDAETGQKICCFLPVRMTQDLFLDKHKSRLAKSEVLKSVFSRAKSPKKEVVHDLRETIELRTTKWGDPGYMDRFHVPIEQYDVSRHLLFVLDAAMKFPPPRV